MQKSLLTAVLLGISAIASAAGPYEDYTEAMEVARENVEDGKWDAAVKDFAEAANLAKTPIQQYTAWLEASRTLEKKGDFPAAVSALRHILEVKNMPMEQQTFARLLIANNLNQKQKKNNEAAAEYEKLISTNLKNHAVQSAYHQLAMLYFHSKDYEKAILVAKRAIQDPVFPNSFKNTERIIVVKSLIAQKKLEEAQNFLDTASKMPDLNINHQVQLNNERAAIMVLNGKIDDAIRLHQETLRLENLPPDWKANVYSRIAEIYFSHKKDLAKAREFIRQSNAVPGATWGKNSWLTQKIDSTEKL